MMGLGSGLWMRLVGIIGARIITNQPHHKYGVGFGVPQPLVALEVCLNPK
jgi:hypothetical protein